jgi:large repetitive protein
MDTLCKIRSIAMTPLLASIAGASLTGCGGGGAGGGGAAGAVGPAGNPPPTSTSVQGTFTPVGSMTTARAYHTAILLPTGKVLIAGGVGQDSQPLASAELYDPATAKFMSVNMTTARADPAVILLPTGKVLIAGGVGQGSQPLASAELYDPATAQFTAVGNMTTAGAQGATLLANGKVLFCCGNDLSAEVFDPVTEIFTATGSMVSTGGTTTLLRNGKVLVTGAHNAQLYDPASGAFTLTGGYADPSPSWDTVTLLLDGRVLLTGCAGYACSVGATELFDPQSGAFSVTGPMRGWAADTVRATLLVNGSVLFLESDLSDILPDAAEIYDPATGTFTHIGGTIHYHAFCAAVSLPVGTVLITGGQRPFVNGVAATEPYAELYLPATRTFALAGTMTTARDFHTATVLPDGTVLIAGGLSFWGSPPKLTSSAEIYKPL